jgi:hypothetical protein
MSNGPDNAGSPLPSEPTSPASAVPASNRPSRRVLAVLLALVVLAGGVAIGSGLRPGGDGDEVSATLAGAELPAEDPALLAVLREYFKQPVQLQHRTFTRDRTEPVVTGLGTLDLRDTCRFDLTFTGALYQVEMHTDGRQLLTRNTKRETGSQSSWESALPLTSNLNSPILALAGNPTSLHCNLISLARTLRSAEGGYVIDSRALVSLLAAQRQQELSALLVLAGADAAERDSVLAGARVDATTLLALIEQVVIELDQRGTMRIAVIGDGGRVLDELLMRHIAEPTMQSPGPIEQRGDQQAAARRLLGLADR